MWDEEDGFYYDLLRLHPDGSCRRPKVRSMMGWLPLCATMEIQEPNNRIKTDAGKLARRYAERSLAGAAYAKRYPGNPQRMDYYRLSDNSFRKAAGGE